MMGGFHPTIQDREDTLSTLRSAWRSMNDTAKLIASSKECMRLSRGCIERSPETVKAPQDDAGRQAIRDKDSFIG